MHKILLSILLTTSLFAKDIIAVLDLEQIGLSKQEATILTQRLTTELISLDKYQVVERNNMDKILKEQKFQHSGCTDSECAVEIGQLLNSDFIVIGSVNKFGDTYALDARLIDVGLGKGKLSAKFSMTGKVDALLTTGINSIAKQLCGMQASTTLKQSSQPSTPTTTSGYGATLDIQSNPQGAEVYIGGNIFDTTPLVLEDFPLGDYEILLKLEGYEDYSQSISLLPRSTKNVSADLIAKPSWIMVRGFPAPVYLSPSTSSVSVYIDGQKHSFTENGKLNISPGSHIVRIASIGYIDYLDTLTILPGKTTTAGYNLERASGYFHSAFAPQEALITIDGDTVANNSTSMLNTGSYNLTAKLTNYYLVNEAVTINMNDTTYINHTLQYGLNDYNKLVKQNNKHVKLAIIPAVMSIATYAVKTYYNSKYEDATSELVKSHYLGIHGTFDTAFTVSSSITLGAGLYITYNKQRTKTLKFKLSL